jgi:hypothetical protein
MKGNIIYIAVFVFRSGNSLKLKTPAKDLFYVRFCVSVVLFVCCLVFDISNYHGGGYHLYLEGNS